MRRVKSGGTRALTFRVWVYEAQKATLLHTRPLARPSWLLFSCRLLVPQSLIHLCNCACRTLVCTKYAKFKLNGLDTIPFSDDWFLISSLQRQNNRFWVMTYEVLLHEQTLNPNTAFQTISGTQPTLTLLQVARSSNLCRAAFIAAALLLYSTSFAPE